MSDIPYSVRDKNVRVNAIKGFNFADISTNEMFKKVDDNNVGGTDVYSEQTSTTNKLSILAGTGILTQTVGTIEGVTDLFTRSLHMNTFGDRNRGITILDNGTSSRVGIGITEPEEDLEIDGNIQIDSANVARLKFQKSGNPATAHALGEIDGEEDGDNGGDLQFFTKVDGGSVTEKLRINNIGAIGIGGANFGNANSVLQSNGDAASVSWTDSPSFVHAKVSNRLSIGNVSRNQNVIFGFSAYNLGAGTVTTIKRLTISQAAGGWNWMDVQIQYSVMVPTFGFPYGAGSARRPIYWTGTGTGQGGFNGNFAKQDSSGNQNDINFRMIYINNTTFDLVFRNDHPSNSCNLSCQVNLRASYADISF